MNWETIAILLMGGGGITAIISSYVMLRKLPVERRSSEASDAATLTKAAADLVADQREEIERLGDRCQTLEKAKRTMRGELDTLRVDLLNYQARIRKLEEQDRQKDTIIENLRNQVNQLESNGVAKDKIIADQRRQIEQLQAELERLKRHLERIEADRASPMRDKGPRAVL